MGWNFQEGQRWKSIIFSRGIPNEQTLVIQLITMDMAEIVRIVPVVLVMSLTKYFI
jgi:hypothetical protein